MQVDTCNLIEFRKYEFTEPLGFPVKKNREETSPSIYTFGDDFLGNSVHHHHLII